MSRFAGDLVTFVRVGLSCAHAVLFITMVCVRSHHILASRFLRGTASV
jgi:hypothetical protein